MTKNPGKQAGNYRLTHIISRGRFADIYLGTHAVLNTQAAIKVLQVPLTPNDVQDFLHEARIITGLTHPHITRVLEFGVEENIPFLVMDYAPNGSLRQRHPYGQIVPIPTVLSYVQQLAYALQYAHTKKLIHRDVKPENILLGPQNEILLSDFDLALGTASLSMQHALHSSNPETNDTAAYMAPEQFQGKPCAASDQYALAVLTYEWLCGERPFSGTFRELLSQHTLAPPPSLRERAPMISHMIEQVVFTALAKDPHHRFENIAAFANALIQSYDPEQDEVTLLVYPQNSSPDSSLTIIPTNEESPEDVISEEFTKPFLPFTYPTPSSNASPWSTLPPSQGASFSSPSAANVPGRSKLAKRSISRRTVLLGGAGVAVIGLAASGLLWRILSHNSHPGSTATANGTGVAKNSSPSSSPSSTRASIGTVFVTYRGHSQKIRALAWSPDGKRIATASDDHTIQVWDALAGKPLTTYNGHTSSVEGVAWSPDGSQIVSGSADATAQIWDANTGSHIRTYVHPEWVNRVDWSRDGKRIVSCDQAGVSGQAVNVNIWDPSTGRTLITYTGHTNGVYAVAFSPDGSRVASAGYDGTLQIWSTSSGNPIAKYDSGGSMDLFGLSWSPDGSRIAVGCSTALILILGTHSASLFSALNGHSKGVKDVAWSHNGAHIASGSDDGTIKIWASGNGTNLYTYSQSGSCNAVGWSPDDKRIASGNDGNNTASIWQAV